MDQYNWQRNKAVVDRLYYSERTVQTTVFFASAYTLTNMFFIKKGFFVPTMRARLMPVWGYTMAFNAAVLFILLKPLRPEEIRTQVDKRINMGKWLYSLFHLEDAYAVESAKKE